MSSPFVDFSSTCLVLLNLLLMCLPYYGMPDEYGDRLERAARVITYIFAGEMSLKLCALGWKDYWGESLTICREPCSAPTESTGAANRH